METNLTKLLSLIIVIILTTSCEKEVIESNEDVQEIKDEYFVSLDEAQAIASQIRFETNNTDSFKEGNSIQTSKRRILSSTSFRDNNGLAAGHIINLNGGGFIIISADKRTPALMAFSNKSEFELDLRKVPLGPNGWLVKVSNIISGIRANKSSSDRFDSMYSSAWEISEIENAVSERKSEEYSKGAQANSTECYYPGYPPGCTSICQDTYFTKGPLLQSIWGQEDGFNDLLPYKGCSGTGNGHALAGCISVAMAQIMRYHQEPSSRYDFSQMPLGISGSREASKLIRDIGNTVNMTYGCNNSWALPSLVDGAFGAYSYSGAIYEKYDNGDYNIVKSNINQNRPVVLEGKEKPLISFDFNHTWHMWVCDGYKTRYDCQNGIGYLYFHMNWGWNGRYDGWYGFQDWTPPGYDNLIDHQEHIVHNIKP